MEVHVTFFFEAESAILHKLRFGFKRASTTNKEPLALHLTCLIFPSSSRLTLRDSVKDNHAVLQLT